MDPMSKATLPGYMGYAQGAQGHPGALPGHHQQLVHHGVAATHNPVMSNMEYVGLDTLGSSHSTPTSGVPAHLAGSAHNVHGMNMAPHLVQGAPSPYSAGNNGGGATVPAVAATPTSYPEVIQEVWKDTLEQAMEDMSSLVHNGYDRIGMDTEFPGVVAHATQAHKSKNGFSSHLWQTIRVNVNILKVIQIGMCFRDRNGDAPPDCPSTFQINFEFDLENDMYAMDSINLLKNSGIDFSQLKYAPLQQQHQQPNVSTYSPHFTHTTLQEPRLRRRKICRASHQQWTRAVRRDHVGSLWVGLRLCLPHQVCLLFLLLCLLLLSALQHTPQRTTPQPSPRRTTGCSPARRCRPTRPSSLNWCPYTSPASTTPSTWQESADCSTRVGWSPLQSA